MSGQRAPLSHEERELLADCWSAMKGDSRENVYILTDVDGREPVVDRLVSRGLMQKDYQDGINCGAVCLAVVLGGYSLTDAGKALFRPNPGMPRLPP